MTMPEPTDPSTLAAASALPPSPALPRRLGEEGSSPPAAAGADDDDPVFFMIGCQRSGSNWLRTMLSGREDLIAPHPPHVLRDFLPKLGTYGDLRMQRNLRVLIDHVCAFVERNQVPWLDARGDPIRFDRMSILARVLLARAKWEGEQKKNENAAVNSAVAMGEGDVVAEGGEKKDECGPSEIKSDASSGFDDRHHLLTVFDAVMNSMAEANGKKIWMCKSMGVSQFHDLLLSFYGKERLRYIYIARDPRDVCLSFAKTPVGDCHPYAVASKWAKLQDHAARVLEECPELCAQVHYEDLLVDSEREVARLVEFMGERRASRMMWQASAIGFKSGNEIADGAKSGREAGSACKLSYQFQNLSRGKSFVAGQYQKWRKEMDEESIRIVESAAHAQMERLGYLSHLVKEEEDRIEFTPRLREEYAAANEALLERMNADLAAERPDDLARRKVQASVLEKAPTFHFDGGFVGSDDVDEDDASLLEATAANGTFNVRSSSFVPDFSAGLEVEGPRTLKLWKKVSVTFAAATRTGYYPDDKDWANQDAYASGTKVEEQRKKRMWRRKNGAGALFAVFDGHGPAGRDCARHARERVVKEFCRSAAESSDAALADVERGPGVVAAAFSSAYRCASSFLEEHPSLDASASGTTACSLFVTKDQIHVANAGDSRCLLIRRGAGGEASVRTLTRDHTLEDVEEAKRIEAAGGIVRTVDGVRRAWSRDGASPGVAFSRSLGDSLAKTIGVASAPDCATFPVPAEGKEATFVLATDGLFDFVPNEEVGEVVAERGDPADACRELVGRAFRRWCASEMRSDDITVIVGRIRMQ